MGGDCSPQHTLDELPATIGQPDPLHAAYVYGFSTSLSALGATADLIHGETIMVYGQGFDAFNNSIVIGPDGHSGKAQCLQSTFISPANGFLSCVLLVDIEDEGTYTLTVYNAVGPMLNGTLNFHARPSSRCVLTNWHSCSPPIRPNYPYLCAAGEVITFDVMWSEAPLVQPEFDPQLYVWLVPPGCYEEGGGNCMNAVYCKEMYRDWPTMTNYTDGLLLGTQVGDTTTYTYTCTLAENYSQRQDLLNATGVLQPVIQPSFGNTTGCDSSLLRFTLVTNTPTLTPSPIVTASLQSACDATEEEVCSGLEECEWIGGRCTTANSADDIDD
eukprot:TRINITY_DN60514_c0_g1_i1.p1 TRINITY_DN60514_c0_g1~~TRINITY_DN60514_c0_g1_i1.p1  ORF type:complete len:329 (+),score=34.96 TRINITY_DN60514_c0_g1_i1:530-1516(+)